MHEINKLETTANPVDAEEGNIPNIDGVFILVLDCQLYSFIPCTQLNSPGILFVATCLHGF